MGNIVTPAPVQVAASGSALLFTRNGKLYHYCGNQLLQELPLGWSERVATLTYPYRYHYSLTNGKSYLDGEQLPFPGPVRSVADSFHGCALVTVEGKLHVRGWNRFGNLGLEAAYEPEKWRPVLLPFQVAQVVLGFRHCVVLSTEGKLYQSGNQQEESQPTGFRRLPFRGRVRQLVTSEEQTLVLDERGQVYATGNEYGGRVFPGLQRVAHCRQHHVVQLVAGSSHYVALLSTGEVWTWGSGRWGALGRLGEDEYSEPESYGQVLLPGPARQVSAGGWRAAVVLADERIFTWGESWDGCQGTASMRDGNPHWPVDYKRIRHLQEDLGYNYGEEQLTH
jgi:alpha-tubulin suppressor-like RCC1 family protein